MILFKLPQEIEKSTCAAKIDIYKYLAHLIHKVAYFHSPEAAKSRETYAEDSRDDDDDGGDVTDGWQVFELLILLHCQLKQTDKGRLVGQEVGASSRQTNGEELDRNSLKLEKLETYQE